MSGRSACRGRARERRARRSRTSESAFIRSSRAASASWTSPADAMKGAAPSSARALNAVRPGAYSANDLSVLPRFWLLLCY